MKGYLDFQRKTAIIFRKVAREMPRLQGVVDNRVDRWIKDRPLNCADS